MTIINAIPKTIPEAAELLDKVNPEWYTKINKETLNMGSCSRCILAQLYGDYALGKEAVFGKYLALSSNSPFGDYASKADWLTQIDSRLQLSRMQNAVKSTVDTSAGAPVKPVQSLQASLGVITVEYPDGYRENFHSALDIPVGVKYRIVTDNK